MAEQRNRPDEDEVVAHETVAFLREHRFARPEQPWFLCASFSRPHFPLTAPRRHFDRYWPDGVTPPRVGASGDAFDHVMSVGMRRGFEADKVEHDEIISEAESIGFPVLVKAAAGGGGKGMRIVEKKEDLAWREWPVRKRLEHALVKGITEFIVDDTEAARQAAERPLIYCGGGVINGEASDALRSFADRFGIPVTTTLMGIGSVDCQADLSLGNAILKEVSVGNF